ncbi:MAG: polyamine aminopropyltransferase [Desulfurispora sp.]|uniref:polyamine aminopropyltransferase n=1 Tax=Desulfurispora sp. TaxID=3014275 RepID=UPI00404B2DE5
MQELWASEMQTPNLRLSCRVAKMLHYEQTPYQELMVVDTYEFGRMLFLDNIIQTNVKDEFVYHEMMAHVGLNTLPHPRRVLVVGGGDGGVIREIIKHPSVEKATLVEIDAKVVEAAQKYLPEISCALTDPRVEVVIDDGIKHVQQSKNQYDMIIVDSTDPIGPAVGLFAGEFYRSVAEALTEDGLFVAQTESPFFNQDLIPRVYKEISSAFPLTRLYLACIPTYPGGLWTFTMGSKKHDPLQVDVSRIPDLNTKYYSPGIHRACFELPPFVANLIK